ncbi:hypothetical protein [Pandoraea sp. 64-18]|nr:hypothetical protein [Pandoraea sp. 64-18]
MSSSVPVKSKVVAVVSVLAVVSPVLVLALAWLFCHQTHAAAPSVAAAIT